MPTVEEAMRLIALACDGCRTDQHQPKLEASAMAALTGPSTGAPIFAGALIGAAIALGQIGLLPVFRTAS